MSVATERARLILAEDWQHPVLRSSMEQLVADIERLQKHVDDLQSDALVTCVYCGHCYGPIKTTPVTKADMLKAHIAQCPEHPMAAVLTSLREMLVLYEVFAGEDECDLEDGVCGAPICRAAAGCAVKQAARARTAISKATGAAP